MKLELQTFLPRDRPPIVEVKLGEDILFDVTCSEAGVWEIGFHPTSPAVAVPLDEVEACIAQAKLLIAQELAAQEGGPHE